MTACLLLFLVISTILSFILIGNTVRERAVEQELPAVVGEIHNDILRQIGAPLATAKEIKSLIDDSVSKVNAGSKLVDSAGTPMTQIVSSVQQVTELMNQIAIANHEQDEGITNVNQAITEMDDATQQNAALVEQAAASSPDQATKLAEVNSEFKLDASLNESHKPILPTTSVESLQRYRCEQTQNLTFGPCLPILE
jgi:uncharacterized phage infection (PIP) family protein YhgE